MKYFILYICVSLLLLCCLNITAVKAQETAFFETLYDIPIMSGLEEMSDMALSFDQPAGRISEAVAILVENIEETVILDFYSLSLEQMGWRKLSQGVFVREGEKLVISFEKSEASHLIRFLLQPY